MIVLALKFYQFYGCRERLSRCPLKVVGSYATLDRLTSSGPEGSSDRLILVCRRVPGHFCVRLSPGDGYRLGMAIA